VQRVHRSLDAVPVGDGPARGDQRLAGDLAAEHPDALLMGTLPPEDVHFDLLEVEEGAEIVEGLGHPDSVTARGDGEYQGWSSSFVPMVMSFSDATARLRTPEGRKLLKYSAASLVSVVVSVVFLVLFVGVFGWGAVVSSTLATAIATIPSYHLNRKWAWGKSGKSHLGREILPFWILAFIGWAFSTYSVRLTEQSLKHNHTMAHIEKTGIVAVVYVGAFGVLWIVKFVIFNKVLFAHRPHDLSTEGVDGLAG
jgi:putative flippase GtrA